MIKKLGIAAAILFVIAIIGFSVKKTDAGSDNDMVKIESQPLHSATGWGYEILVDHKVFIHQEYIPAVVGGKAFLTKEDAMKTAGLVIQKLMNRQKPAISKDDLAALRISSQ